MSLDPFPHYGPREMKLVKLIEHLSENKEVTQSNLPKIIGCHTRTIQRLLLSLEVLGLAKKTGTKKQKGRGKPSNIWRATFSGLMQAIYNSFFLREDIIKKIEKISDSHGTEWIIFKEWAVLTKNPEVKKYIHQNLLSLLISSFFRIFLSSSRSSRVAQRGELEEYYSASRGFDKFVLLSKKFEGIHSKRKEIMEDLPSELSSKEKSEFLEAWPKYVKWMDEQLKIEMTSDLLGLDEILKGIVSMNLLDYYMKIPNIRKFIENQILQDEERYIKYVNSINQIKKKYY